MRTLKRFIKVSTQKLTGGKAIKPCLKSPALGIRNLTAPLRSDGYMQTDRTYNPLPMKIHKQTPILLLLCLLFSPVLCANAGNSDEPNEAIEATPPVSLAELAAEADVVALVQMRDGDYRLVRDIPVSGSAYLKVLIPYKVDQPLEFIDVYEFGLHPNECYFPNPTVVEEGRRYLVFLRRDPEDAERYRGLPQGCALDVLVTSDNGYALRIPATGIDLKDSLLELATEQHYADPYARETEETLDSQTRDAWLKNGWLRRETGENGDELVYTLGITLNDVRALMGPDAVSLDRHQKRIPENP